jgi:hypothetical protein
MHTTNNDHKFPTVWLLIFVLCAAWGLLLFTAGWLPLATVPETVYALPSVERPLLSLWGALLPLTGDAGGVHAFARRTATAAAALLACALAYRLTADRDPQSRQAAPWVLIGVALTFVWVGVAPRFGPAVWATLWALAALWAAQRMTRAISPTPASAQSTTPLTEGQLATAQRWCYTAMLASGAAVTAGWAYWPLGLIGLTAALSLFIRSKQARVLRHSVLLLVAVLLLTLPTANTTYPPPLLTTWTAQAQMVALGVVVTLIGLVIWVRSPHLQGAGWWPVSMLCAGWSVTAWDQGGMAVLIVLTLTWGGGTVWGTLHHRVRGAFAVLVGTLLAAFGLFVGCGLTITIPLRLLGTIEPSQLLPVRFGDVFLLVDQPSYQDSIQSFGNIDTIRLAWRPLRVPPRDYSIVLFVVDHTGTIVSQYDAPLADADGAWTSTWTQTYRTYTSTLPIPPNLANGRYKLYVAIYLAETLERLPVSNGETWWYLGEL